MMFASFVKFYHIMPHISLPQKSIKIVKFSTVRMLDDVFI